MTINAQYPKVRPTLLLDFSTGKLDPRIAFGRSSPAMAYDGKTVVKAEENLVTYSQDYTQGTSHWVKYSLTNTANTTTAPDGSSTASTLTSAAGNTQHYLEVASVVNLSSTNVVFTTSVFVKASTTGFVTLSFSAGTTTPWIAVTVDLVNGVVTKTGQGAAGVLTGYSISPANNGWYRVSVSGYMTSGTYTYAWLSINSSGNPTYGSYGLESWNAAGTEAVYLWGFQLEQRAYATAYTPTTTAAITNYIPALQSYAANVARFDFNPVTGESLGLMVEEQRTNLLSYSQDLSVPTWIKDYSLVRVNLAIAPDGTLTANKFIPDATLNYHRVYQAASSISGSVGAHSAYVKAGELTKVALRETQIAGNYAVFDLSAGTVIAGYTATTPTITPVGNGWYRISIAITTASQAWGIYGVPNAYTTGSPTTAFSGDGYSGLYVWGAQLEAGAFATSYIPTLLTYSGRGSTATYIGDNGLIQTAAANVARYQRNIAGATQLLLESASTNLLKDTQNFVNGWSTTGTVVIRNNIGLAPDGTFTASKLIANSTNTGHFVAMTGLASTVGVMSFYAKAAEETIVSGWLTNSNVGGSFNLSTGVATTQGATAFGMTPAGNGWWRCWVYNSTASTTVTIYSRIGNGFVGDGSSGVLIWGAQFEAGSVPTSYIPSTETFTGRSGTATYFDPSGVMRTAPSGLARYDFDPVTGLSKGLLIEGAGQNLITYSQDMSGWTVANGTITGNAATAPDGTTTANQFVSAAGAAAHFFQRDSTTTAVVHTVSIFAKYDSVQYLYLDAYTSTASPAAVFDLQNGTLVSTTGIAATITPIGSGWYRCSMTFTAEAGITQIRLFPTTSSGGASYTGDGIHGVYAWGAQLETGSVATSYIPTTTTPLSRVADSATSVANSRAADVWSSGQATRSAELVSMTGTNFSQWYRQDEGTFYGEAVPITVSSTVRAAIASVTNGTTNNIMSFGENSVGNGAGSVDFYIRNGGTDQANLYAAAASTVGNVFKVAGAFKVNDIAASVNGAAVLTDTSAVIPAVSQMNIGHNGQLTLCNLYIKRIAFYPKRLTNTELQGLTS